MWLLQWLFEMAGVRKQEGDHHRAMALGGAHAATNPPQSCHRQPKKSQDALGRSNSSCQGQRLVTLNTPALHFEKPGD